MQCCKQLSFCDITKFDKGLTKLQTKVVLLDDCFFDPVFCDEVLMDEDLAQSCK